MLQALHRCRVYPLKSINRGVNRRSTTVSEMLFIGYDQMDS